MKKILICLLCFLIVLGVFNYSGGTAANEITVKLNGSELSFDQSPINEEGRILVPFRVIFEAMGCSVEWKEDANMVVASTADGKTVELQIDDTYMKKPDGSLTELDVSPKILNGRTLVPVRAVSEALGADVTWDESAQTVYISYGESVSASFKEDDYYFDRKDDAKKINLSEGAPEVIGSSGVYELTGTLSDGSVTVNVDKETDKGTVFLVLNSASITNAAVAPINIAEAKKVVIILEPGTVNEVYGGSEDAAIFSKADLTITGSGTLNVTADYNDGITSKDKLKITDGNIFITSKADGIVGKDLVAIEKANLTINAGKDGIRSANTDTGKGNILIVDGTFNITAANDAVTAQGILQIDNGTFDISTGGGYPGTIIKSSGQQGMGGDFAPPQMGERPQSGQENRPPQMGGRQQSGQENLPPQMREGQQSFNQMDVPPQRDEQQEPLQPEIQEENISSTAEEESKKALKGTGGIVINGGTFDISAYDDAIHSNAGITISGGTIEIETGDDGIHADGSVTINAGTVNIKNCYEGIEGKYITVNNGTVSITAGDDGFNINDSSGVLTINAGDIYINANGDGIDSNGTIFVTGGAVYIDGPTANGNGALDSEGSFTISGGVLVAAGSSGMAQAPGESSSQASVMMYYSGTQEAGAKITLQDSHGNEIAGFTPSKQYQTVIISSPQLEAGSDYSLYSDSAKVVGFTLESGTTYINESGVTQRTQGRNRPQRGQIPQQ